MSKKLLLGIALSALLGSPLSAQQAGQAKVGALSCRTSTSLGGSHRSFALQPISVESQVGVNLASGVAGLMLASAR